MIDMIFKRFGRLTVIKECEERKDGKKIYKCICDCGNITYVKGTVLRSGRTKSCGCLMKDITIKRSTKHGKSHTRLYKIYCSMKQRCYNKNDKHYKWYGKKSIKICDEWLNNFQAFYDWSMSNGYNDNLTIDRIDVNGNYEPYNCRWTDQKTQQNNKTNNVYITYNNKTQNITKWAEELNINRNTIYTRYLKGWSDKDCLFGRDKHKHKTLFKYDYITNKILNTYNSILEASLHNDIKCSTIRRQTYKHIFHNNKQGFYFGYSPKMTIKIYCYDNESLDLIDIYSSIEEASKKTGVGRYEISYQCKLKTKLNNRKKGTTGLFFEKKV